MKKTEQITINAYVLNIANDIDALMRTSSAAAWNRLYNSKAEWAQIGDWMILRRYSTIVAAYNVNTDELFDYLLLNYFYTTTAGQDIAKFHAFCRSVTGNGVADGNCGLLYRWRVV